MIVRKVDEYAVIDQMPPEMRALVHDFGMSVVSESANHGVTKPGSVRQLVRIIRQGAREPGNKRHPGVHNTQAGPLLAALDTWLVAQGAGFTARQVIRAIRDSGFTALPTSPIREMTAASMETISDGTLRVTKEQKHQRRLQAALNAGDRAMWGAR